MNKPKRILIIASSVVLFSVVVPMLMGQPFVLDLSSDTAKSAVVKYHKGDIVNPLEQFNFNEGEWSAYLFISSSDKSELPEEMPKGKRLKTTDKSLLKQMQKQWRFIYTEGDVATVESEIVLCHNGKQVFKSGIVLDKARQGLQNRQYGWLEASPNGILTDQCKKFEKMYFPVLIK